MLEINKKYDAQTEQLAREYSHEKCVNSRDREWDAPMYYDRAAEVIEWLVKNYNVTPKSE